MRYSDNYELNLVEGSDIVNPLVQDVPNYEAIDAAMFNNKEHSVGVATELKTGTVHSLTRQNEDAAVFRFTATSDYSVGDTFEVDGVQVSALLVDGTTLPDRCYIIGSEVLASLKGTLLTVYANRTTASDSDKLGGQLPAYYATDADLDTLEGVVDAHTDQISQLNSDLNDNVIVRKYTHTPYHFNAQGFATFNNIDVSYSGYTPIGVVGNMVAGDLARQAMVYQQGIDSSTHKLFWSCQNISTTGSADWTFSFNILYVKNRA